MFGKKDLGRVLSLSSCVTPPKKSNQNSAIDAIPGIVTWFETTLEKSFDKSETHNGATITNWYDINPQTITKNNAKQNSADAKLHPIYKTNCINSLPCLRFNGSTSFIETLQSTEVVTKELSIFAIVRPNKTLPDAEQAYVSTSGSWEGGTSFTLKQYPKHSADYQIPNSVDVFSPGRITAGETYMVSLVDDGSIGTTYLNGVAGYPTATANPEIITKKIDVLTIGAFRNSSEIARYFDGYIGEIIIFERALKDDDRKIVERYLGEKWGIALPGLIRKEPLPPKSQFDQLKEFVEKKWLPMFEKVAGFE